MGRKNEGSRNRQSQEREIAPQLMTIGMRGMVFQKSIQTFILAAMYALASQLPLGAAFGQSKTEADSIHEFLRLNFTFSQGELAAIDRGEIITRVLETDNPGELAVCGAVHVRVPLDFAVEKYREIETFKASSAVPEIGRISKPPGAGDFDGLTIEEDDINALRDCRPGDCKVKLPATMMQRFRTEVDWNNTDYRAQVLALTKEMLLDFVKSYLAEGNAGMGEYDDQGYVLLKAKEFHDILHEKPSLFSYAPDLIKYLDQFPNAPTPNATDFIYWQKETFEKIKPVIGINHVTIYVPDAGHSNTLIASKEIYANHYLEASLVISALLEDGSQPGFYVLYLNRSRFDDLRKKGFLDMTSAIRSEIHKRVQDELMWTKERVESLYESHMGGRK